MRRASVLHTLSREHHRALVMAKRLASGKREGWEDFVEHDLLAHFAVEEGALLRLLWRRGGKQHAHRLQEEHRALERLVETGDAETFGRLLQEHVRYEERELFPWLEQHLDSEALAELRRGMAPPPAPAHMPSASAYTSLP